MMKSPLNEDASSFAVIWRRDAFVTYLHNLNCWTSYHHFVFYFQQAPFRFGLRLHEGDLGEQATARSIFIILKPNLSSVCMCVCVYVCMCVYVWMCVCVCVYVYVYVYGIIYNNMHIYYNSMKSHDIPIWWNIPAVTSHWLHWSTRKSTFPPGHRDSERARWESSVAVACAAKRTPDGGAKPWENPKKNEDQITNKWKMEHSKNIVDVGWFS